MVFAEEYYYEIRPTSLYTSFIWCGITNYINLEQRFPKGVRVLQWQEVRTIYPDQYVLIEILDSHVEDDIQYVEEVALVRAIKDPSEATQELLRCKNNNI